MNSNTPIEKKRVHIKVSGRVQGVCFRFYTRHKANSLGLTGFVRNLPNGSSVEIVAEGNEDSLEELIKWAKKGPPAANVLDMTISRENFMGEFSSFDVTH